MRINVNGKELQEFIKKHDVNLDSYENGKVVLRIRKDMAVSHIFVEVLVLLENENKNFKFATAVLMPIEVHLEMFEFVLSFNEKVSI